MEQKPPEKTENNQEWRNVSEVKDIISQRDKWKQAAEEKNSRLAEYERKEQSAKDNQQVKELEDQKKYQEAIELQNKKHVETFKGYADRVKSRLIPTAIKAALTQIEDLAPEAANDIPNLLQGKVGLSEDLEPIVLDEDGKPMVDKATMKPITIDAYVKEFVEKRPYLRLSTQSKSTGLSHGHRAGSGWDIERAIKDSVYADEWIKADKAGYELASKEYFSPERMQEMARKRWTK